MDDMIMTVVENVLIIFVTVVAGYAVAYLRKRMGIEGMRRVEVELALKQELAALAVRFIEQAYRDLHGPGKYQKAADWLAGRARERGLNITSDEIQGLIEAALRAFKDEFGEGWARAGS